VLALQVAERKQQLVASAALTCSAACRATAVLGSVLQRRVPEGVKWRGVRELGEAKH